MITSHTKMTPDAEVVFTEMQNGESVLLHLGTGHYFSLNQTGTIIWQSLENGLSMAEIAGVLAENFDVTQEGALQSVLDLVSALANARLVHISGDPADDLPGDG